MGHAAWVRAAPPPLVQCAGSAAGSNTHRQPWMAAAAAAQQLQAPPPHRPGSAEQKSARAFLRAGPCPSSPPWVQQLGLGQGCEEPPPRMCAHPEAAQQLQARPPPHQGSARKRVFAGACGAMDGCPPPSLTAGLASQAGPEAQQRAAAGPEGRALSHLRAATVIRAAGRSQQSRISFERSLTGLAC